ncbi:hypothetical protein PHET_11328 [Paragonimus heterotremus]|uniref:Uncharacterized protein n=1 Tax=Paragonimus heterotremus TaxID=100268 RepID=A0A8J4T1C1_9TREM|nr:hypothetical protein PHET_11328 [Paragonimus heterotremus]
MCTSKASLDVASLKEYDSLLRLLKRCSNVASKGWSLTRPKDLLRLTCFDVCEDYAVFCWTTGILTIIERNQHNRIHSIKIEDRRQSILSKSAETAVTSDVTIRISAASVVCVCLCTIDPHVRNSHAICKNGNTEIFIFRIPRCFEGTLIVKN